MSRQIIIHNLMLLIGFYVTVSLMVSCQLKSAPTEEELEVQKLLEETALFSQDQRILIQRGLNDLGYSTAEEQEGIFEEKTRQAIRTWQKDTQQQETGYLTEQQGTTLKLIGEQAGDFLVQEIDRDNVIEELSDMTETETEMTETETEMTETETETDMTETETVPIELGESFKDCEFCPEMIVVPSGTSTMGSALTAVHRKATESPSQQITIEDDFAVSVFEVTFEEWERCVLEGGCNGHAPDDRGWGKGRRPVINVSWNDAQAYVTWLSQKTQKDYRLLTEAEWEYVARAGTSTRYWWGEDVNYKNICQNANSADYSTKQLFPNWTIFADCKDLYAYTAPVGSFRKNPFGLYDINGNVSEWVEDCWRESYTQTLDADKMCQRRVLRGGNWSQNPVHSRSASRTWGNVDQTTIMYGIRVARSL